MFAGLLGETESLCWRYLPLIVLGFVAGFAFFAQGLIRENVVHCKGCTSRLDTYRRLRKARHRMAVVRLLFMVLQGGNSSRTFNGERFKEEAQVQ